jgi:hypothetical protein
MTKDGARAPLRRKEWRPPQSGQVGGHHLLHAPRKHASPSGQSRML